MADITLSPLPVHGGTLNMTSVNSHIAYLGNSRFFALFSQATPNYLMGATFELSTFTGPATLTNVKQRILSVEAPTKIRVWRLNNSTALALVGSELRVYKISANGDITRSATVLENFHTSHIFGSGTSAYGIGPQLYGQTIKDNTVWFVQRATTTSSIVLSRIDYNTSTEGLTHTTMQTLVVGTTATHMWMPHIQKIRGTTDYLVYCVGGNTTYATSTIPRFDRYSQSGTLLQSVTTMPASVQHLVYLSATRVLGIVGTRTYVVFNGTSWTTTPATFAAGDIVPSARYTILSQAVDDQNFLLFGSSLTVSAYVRIAVCRHVSDIIGQTSSYTDNGAQGIGPTTANLYPDTPVQVITENRTFVAFGIGPAAQGGAMPVRAFWLQTLDFV